jgi:hypothetical protein
MPVVSSICRVVLVLLFSVGLVAQSSTENGTARPGTTAQQGVQQPSAQTDEMAQMREDLNKMESLNMNMSSEIEFLHDQNLQILLRTNSQMWTILIRDLRRQMDREQQRKTVAPAR